MSTLRQFSQGNSLKAILLLMASGMTLACESGDFESPSSLDLSQATSHAERNEEPEKPELKWALPSEEDDAPGDPMKIVHNQRIRLQEFAELTQEALQLRPSECDTEMRVEVEGEMIPITITLPEQPFDFRRYRSARDSKSREALRVERQNQLLPIQEDVAQKVEQLGGHISQYEYITNALDAEIPVCELDNVALLENVLGIEVDNQEITTNSVNGIQRRAAFGLPASGHAIFNGSLGSTQNSGNAVRFGVIEWDSNLNSSHLSFRRGDGTSRIVDTDRCAYWFPSYRCINSATAPVSSHGTMVTSIILSDFSQGQSSAITTVSERNKRAGIAPRATVHFYSAKDDGLESGFRNVRAAIKEAALEDGVDIINMSLGATSTSHYCASPSLSKTREALEAAREAGVVSVASAGNNGETIQPCKVNPPGSYSTTISVGGTNTAPSLTSLESVSRAPRSSYGTASFSIAGGETVSVPMVDVAANYFHNTVAGDGSTGIDSGGGTSFAAPSIAGIVGLIKHWIAYRGGLPQSMADDPTAIRAILALMADGRSKNKDASTNIDGEFGYGNVRFINLDTDIGTHGSWGIHRVSVNTGSFHEWNIGNIGVEASQLQGFKAVAIAERDNYSESPDIEFQLVHKCGSSAQTLLYRATRNALQWRMRAWNSLVPFLIHDRCLRLQVKAEAATSSTNLYVAWMLYSNERIHHDASNQ